MSIDQSSFPSSSLAVIIPILSIPFTLQLPQPATYAWHTLRTLIAPPPPGYSAPPASMAPQPESGLPLQLSQPEFAFSNPTSHDIFSAIAFKCQRMRELAIGAAQTYNTALSALTTHIGSREACLSVLHTNITMVSPKFQISLP
jgi:hypothetical protein